MKRLRVALLLMAAGCATEPAPAKPAPAGPVERLADPDPAVSAAAREELLALDDFAVPGLRADAANTENLTARMALLEIADTIETRTLAVAREWESMPRYAMHLDFDVLEKSGVPPCAVFLRWLSRPRGDEEKPARSLFRSGDIQLLGLSWLRAYTFADLGKDPAAWREFLEKHHGRPVAGMRRQGLIQRGFEIADPDPNKAARAYRSAGNPGNLKASDGSRWISADPEDYLYQAFADLLGADFALPASSDKSPPHVQQALDWIELNDSWFAWEGGRLVSRAGAEEYLSVYHAGSALLRLVALAELRRWPERIPRDAWNLVDLAPSLVAHAMHCAGVPVPREALPVVLTALGPANDPGELAKIWNVGDLEALAQDKDAAISTRAEAIRVLATLDAQRGLALCTSILNTCKDRRLVSAAILACTRFPGNTGLDAAESWLAAAEDGPDRFDVAIALARRGRESGMEVILKRASGDLLDRRRAALVREFVEGVPDEDHDHEWKTWAAERKGFVWSPEVQKWKPTE
ncbi:MAG: HEAT repeat domain-containing protein [Planctomycetota bacterium]